MCLELLFVMLMIGEKFSLGTILPVNALHVSLLSIKNVFDQELIFILS